MSSHDCDYYRSRAREHRSKAAAADLPHVAAIHEELAVQYDDLAQQFDLERTHGISWGNMPAPHA